MVHRTPSLSVVWVRSETILRFFSAITSSPWSLGRCPGWVFGPLARQLPQRGSPDWGRGSHGQNSTGSTTCGNIWSIWGSGDRTAPRIWAWTHRWFSEVDKTVSDAGCHGNVSGVSTVEVVSRIQKRHKPLVPPPRAHYKINKQNRFQQGTTEHEILDSVHFYCSTVRINLIKKKNLFK